MSAVRAMPLPATLLTSGSAGGAALKTDDCASRPQKVWADCDPDKSSLGSLAATMFEQAPKLHQSNIAEAGSEKTCGGQQTIGWTSQGRSSDGNLSSDMVQVKNTFIHVDTPESSFVELDGRHLQSAPAKVEAFSTKYPSMEAAHIRGDCKPCAYFLYKEDGCRQGGSCEFCHLCSKGELKKRKKERAAARKQKATPSPADGFAAATGPAPYSSLAPSEAPYAGLPIKVVPSTAAPPAGGPFRGVYNAFGTLVSLPSAARSAADGLAAFSVQPGFDQEEEDGTPTPRLVYGARFVL